MKNLHLRLYSTPITTVGHGAREKEPALTSRVWRKNQHWHRDGEERTSTDIARVKKEPALTSRGLGNVHADIHSDKLKPLALLPSCHRRTWRLCCSVERRRRRWGGWRAWWCTCPVRRQPTIRPPSLTAPSGWMSGYQTLRTVGGTNT